MSATLFIAFPLLFGFLALFFDKVNKRLPLFASILTQLFLLKISIDLFKKAPFIEEISISQPLGISFAVNELSLIFVTLFIFMTLIATIYYLTQKDIEYKFLILINMLLAGSIGLVLSKDIFNIYVFFEITGISAYILSAYNKDRLSLEAGIKYLITGSIASIFFIFAIFLIYLNIGSLDLEVIGANFSKLSHDIKILILIFLLVGLGFKVEIFPLNFWVSDIYQGSLPLVNMLFSTIVAKAYLFLFFNIFYAFKLQEYAIFLVILGSVSMVAGELFALTQNNLKRVFAYSSIAQVGFLFSIVPLGSLDAIKGVVYLTIAHSLAKGIIFLAINDIYIKYGNFDIENLKKVDSKPLIFALIIATLSILGVPLLVGFVGKFLSLKSLFSGGFVAIFSLLIVGFLIEAIYYFKMVGFLLQKSRDGDKLRLSLIKVSIYLVMVFAIVLLGVFPTILSDIILSGAKEFLIKGF